MLKITKSGLCLMLRAKEYPSTALLNQGLPSMRVKGSDNMVSYRFNEALKLRHYSKNTISEYVRRINQWFRFLMKYKEYDQVLDVMHVDKGDVIKYRAWLLHHKQGHRTVNSKISTIYIFYKFAKELDFIERNPVEDVEYLRTSKPDTPRLNDHEIAVLKAWFDTLQPNLRAAFYLIYGAGLRVSEATNLNYSDVSLKNGALMINVTDAKYHSDRKIPVMDEKSARVVYDYKLHEEPSSDKFFHVTSKTIQWYARKFAGLYGMYFHVHMLRHNFATKLYEKGYELPKIQALLGHKSINMTLYYIHHANQSLADITPHFFKKDNNNHRDNDQNQQNGVSL